MTTGCNSSGGGGGGGDASFAHSGATNVTFGTSALTQSGFVTLSWPAGPTADEDGDGVPDQVDRCGASDRSPTVVIDGCDSGAINDLEADGCTIADRMAKIAADAENHRQFVGGVAVLTTQLRQRRVITCPEQGALLLCAVKADLP